MVEKVIWSKEAIQDRKEIFTYWKNRNKSDIYNLKLRILINNAIKTVQLYPKIGKLTSKENVRIIIVKHFFCCVSRIRNND